MSEVFANQDHITINEIINLFKNFCIDQEKLVNGYKILSNYERKRGFYIGILEIILIHNQNDKILTRLCCSSFNVFLKKNWILEEYIEQSEKSVNF